MASAPPRRAVAGVPLAPGAGGFVTAPSSPAPPASTRRSPPGLVSPAKPAGASGSSAASSGGPLVLGLVLLALVPIVYFSVSGGAWSGGGSGGHRHSHSHGRAQRSSWSTAVVGGEHDAHEHSEGDGHFDGGARRELDGGHIRGRAAEEDEQIEEEGEAGDDDDDVGESDSGDDDGDAVDEGLARPPSTGGSGGMSIAEACLTVHDPFSCSVSDSAALGGAAEGGALLAKGAGDVVPGATTALARTCQGVCATAEAALSVGFSGALSYVTRVHGDFIADLRSKGPQDASPVRLTSDDVHRYILTTEASFSSPPPPCLLSLLGASEDVQAAARKLHAYASDPSFWGGFDNAAPGVGSFARSDSNGHYAARREYRDTFNVLAGHYARMHVSPPLLLGGGGAPEISSPPATHLPVATNPCKRLVISISTVPSRLAKLGFVIRAMKWQKHQPDAIVVGLAPFATRLKAFYEIPPELLADPLVKIVPLPVDFGPLSKLMGAIYAEEDPETCIMTVDDDAEPQPDVFLHLLSWASVLPRDMAVGFGGWNSTCIVGNMPLVCTAGAGSEFLYTQPHVDHMCQESTMARDGGNLGVKDCFTPVSDEPRGVQVLQGVRGVLYRRGMFQPDFVELPTYVAKQRVMRMVKELEGNEEVVRRAAEAPQQQEGGVDAAAAAKGGGAEGVDAMAELAHAHGGGDAAAIAAAHASPGDAVAKSAAVLRFARELLSTGALAHVAGEDKWARLSPPLDVFFVDDVYIAAYLSWKGVDKIAIPLKNTSKLPVQPFPYDHKPYTLYLKLHYDPGEPLMTTVDSLHSSEGFNNANSIAATYFRYLHWW